MKRRVAICSPTRNRPHDAFIEALERSVPYLDAAGFDHAAVFEVGCPYISGARCTLLGKALAWGATDIVFIDDDVSWQPEDLVRLVETEGDVVCGTYRYKIEEPKFMGVPYVGHGGHPLVRADGCVHMMAAPAGFLRVSRETVKRFRDHFPDLAIGDAKTGENVDIFNHGAYMGVWFGEDYAMCRRLGDMGIDVWCIPTLNLVHNDPGKAFGGTYHEYLTTYRKPEERMAA